MTKIYKEVSAVSDEIQLTDGADYLLCVLYDDYVQRRKNGESAFDAKFFGGPEAIQSELIPKWPTHDIEEHAFELFRNELVALELGNNTFSQGRLEDRAIACMQRRFGRKAGEVLQHIAALRMLLFG